MGGPRDGDRDAPEDADGEGDHGRDGEFAADFGNENAVKGFNEDE